MRAVLLASLLLASCAPLDGVALGTVSVRSHYVAMGSSFASGPGVTRLADQRDPRCSRSNDNYAQQVARSLDLHLVDVSCGGATTDHVLNGWSELPPQLDALNADTRLVTVTIGGNDVGYIASLFAGSCGTDNAPSDAVKVACAGLRARRGSNSAPVAADEAQWKAVEAGLKKIAAEVKRRAPRARLIFVEYLSVVPAVRTCALVPLSADALQRARDTAARLARLNQSVASQTGAEFLPVSRLSQGHDACSKTPWTTGFVPSSAATKGNFVPYHPNIDGMTAVAKALIKKLK